MEFGHVRPAIESFDANANIFRRFLRILDYDVEVPIVIEDARIQQLEFALTLSPPVFLHQLLIGVFALRILVEHPHVTVGGRHCRGKTNIP